MTAERHLGLAVRDRSWSAPRRSASRPIEIDVLLERAVQQRRGAEVEDDAVGLDDARVLFGSTVRRPRPTIWIMVHLNELGRSSTTQLVGGWSQPSVSTATLTTTWASPAA